MHERIRHLQTGPKPALGIRLLHTARLDGAPGGNGEPYHRVRDFLDGTATDLDQVTKVVYHLHPTFPQPERVIADRSTSFAPEMRAWGQFTLTAEVCTAYSPTPTPLERYLSF
ncbi:pYEATS domain-containing protein [Kitasatospora herbaricolor]|uniref:YEATS domain-containing protein n=1 Tax=Kitasatospora herbaricolor TaxID=68217 RepID=A0ABZ1WIU1_9ACTN|nr:pYEATS domain-containing protein [Kitasatospora herbaricolor]